MTIQTRPNKRVLTFRKSDCEKSLPTNSLCIAGLPVSTTNNQLLSQDPLEPVVSTIANVFPAPVPDFMSGEVCLPVGVGRIATLDCVVGGASCGGEEGAAVVSHGGYSDNYKVTSVNLPASDTSVGAGCHGPVVQMSPSHTSFHHHPSHGTQ